MSRIEHPDAFFAYLFAKHSKDNKYKVQDSDELKEIVYSLRKVDKDELPVENNILDLNLLDTSNVTNMENLLSTDSFQMFDFLDYGIKLDVSEWDTSNVININNIFKSIRSGDNLKLIHNFDETIKKWDLSNVEYAEGAFENTKFNVFEKSLPKLYYLPNMFSRAEGNFVNLKLRDAVDISSVFSRSKIDNIKLSAPNAIFGRNLLRDITHKVNSIDLDLPMLYDYTQLYGLHPTGNDFDTLYKLDEFLNPEKEGFKKSMQLLNKKRKEMYNKLRKNVFTDSDVVDYNIFNKRFNKLSSDFYSLTSDDLQALSLVSNETRDKDYITHTQVVLENYEDLEEKNIDRISPYLPINTSEDYKKFVNFKDLVYGKEMTYKDLEPYVYAGAYKFTKNGALELMISAMNNKDMQYYVKHNICK